MIAILPVSFGFGGYGFCWHLPARAGHRDHEDVLKQQTSTSQGQLDWWVTYPSDANSQTEQYLATRLSPLKADSTFLNLSYKY